MDCSLHSWQHHISPGLLLVAGPGITSLLIGASPTSSTKIYLSTLLGLFPFILFRWSYLDFCDLQYSHPETQISLASIDSQNWGLKQDPIPAALGPHLALLLGFVNKVLMTYTRPIESSLLFAMDGGSPCYSCYSWIFGIDAFGPGKLEIVTLWFFMERAHQKRASKNIAGSYNSVGRSDLIFSSHLSVSLRNKKKKQELWSVGHWANHYEVPWC